MTILDVRGLGKRFGGLSALAEVDLDVERGRIVGVIGPNGAGKSTLLEIISGMLAPTTSSGILFEGTDLTGLKPHQVRHLGVAKVLQTPRGFESMTVLENVALGAMFGGEARRTEPAAIDVAREQLELLGLDTGGHEEIGRLDLHQKRLLDLARALAGRPRLLLLDEVMAGLNPSELTAFVAVIRRVRDELGITVLMVEHVMKAVNALADHVVVLHLGRKLTEGAPQDVMRDRDVIEAYLGRGATRDARG